MSDTKANALASGVDLMRSIVADWDAFSRQFDGLSKEHGELRAQLATLTQQHRDLQDTHERSCREREEKERDLTDLRAKHAALLQEHERLNRAHGELTERYERLRSDRERAAGELEALLQRLKP